MAHQWNQESTLDVPRIGDPSHDYGTDSPPNDGHDEKGRAEFGVRAEVFDTQREDGREHDGVEEAEQHDGCNGWHARAEQNDRQREQRASGKDAEQPARSDLVHYCRTGEPSKHETKQMCLQKASRNLFMRSRQGELTEPDDEAGNSYLCADVAKLRHHTLDEMRECQSSTELRVATP